MSDEVKIGYASSSNVTFHGELETGMTRQEWEELGEEGQKELMEEMVWELIEMWPIVPE